MAIVSVTELPRQGVTVDARWGRRGTRRFRVRVSDKNTGASYAVFAPGIPRPGAFWATDDELDVGLRALEAQADQDTDDPFVFIVTVPYSSTRAPDPAQQTSGGGSGGSPPNDNPLAEPPRWQWGRVHDSRALFYEYDLDDPFSIGRAVCNSAGQPFSPRPTVDDARLSLTFTRNEATFDAQDAWYYYDTVNSHPFLGFGVYQVKCGYIVGQNDYRNGIRFVTKTYYFEVKWPDWRLRILDQGTVTLDDNGKQVPVVKPGGLNNIVLLNGAGKEWTDTAHPKFLTFDPYAAVSFAALNIHLF